jgi:ankyrin repeat protein
MIAIGLTVAMMITSAKAETKVEQEKANRLVQLFLPEGRNAPDIIYGSTVGDLALVKSTLDDGVDVNMRWGELGQTPLMYAAMGGHTNICEFLIDHGADPSLYDRGMDSSAPIHHAAEWGRDDVIRYFASIGENLDRPTQQNFRPIDVAAYSGQAESIKTFVELGISLYSSSADESDYQLSSPLGIAIWNNQTDSVSMLLELGIKVHPQHLEDAGVAHCEIRLLRLLLDKSSDRSIEILTRMLRGLCHMSQYREHSLESARYLLDQGADPNRRAGYARFVSHKGDSPIDQAIDNVTLHWDTSADYPGRQDAALALLDLLLEYGGNIDQLVFEIASGGNASLLDRVPESNLRRYNQRGEMPIHIAARGNRSEVIQYLLDAGLDVDAPPRPDSRVLGSTPLSFAVGADSVEAAQILIKNGANVNALESNSVLARNLLYVAIRTSKDGRMVKLLIDSGMPPEGLHAAVSYLANPSAVRILIAAGADLQAKNDAGRTPLEEAMAYKSSNESKQVAIAECVQLLREAEGKE